MSLTSSDISSICSKSTAYSQSKNTAKMIDDMMKDVSKKRGIPILTIGARQLRISELDYPIIDILLQSAMAQCINRMDKLQREITDIVENSSKNDRSGDDSANENDPQVILDILRGSKTAKLNEDGE